MVNLLAPKTRERVTIMAGIVISVRKDGTVFSYMYEEHLYKEHNKNIIENMWYAHMHVCMHVCLYLGVQFTNTKEEHMDALKILLTSQCKYGKHNFIAYETNVKGYAHRHEYLHSLHHRSCK